MLRTKTDECFEGLVMEMLTCDAKTGRSIKVLELTKSTLLMEYMRGFPAAMKEVVSQRREVSEYFRRAKGGWPNSIRVGAIKARIATK